MMGASDGLRVGLIISSLGSGGAERTVVNLAAALAQRGYAVTVLTYSDGDADFYTLPSGVERIALKLLRRSSHLLAALANNLRRLRVLRRALVEGQYDVVVSFMDATNVQTVLAATGLPVRVVISERIHPAFHQAGRIWSMLRARTYDRANGVVVQTAQIRDWVCQHTRASDVVVIPNFLNDPAPADTAPAYERRARRVIAAGRLHRQKGFDILLDAVSTMQAVLRANSWQVVIYGEGPERQALQAQCDTLGLQDIVSLAGRTDVLTDEMQQSRVFVLSSRNEGFPNVLLEAMAAGCAVCAFAEVSGVDALIQNDVNGLQVPQINAQALTKTLQDLIGNEAKAARLAESAREVRERYELSAVVPLWEAVLRGGTSR